MYIFLDYGSVVGVVWGGGQWRGKMTQWTLRGGSSKTPLHSHQVKNR